MVEQVGPFVILNKELQISRNLQISVNLLSKILVPVSRDFQGQTLFLSRIPGRDFSGNSKTLVNIFNLKNKKLFWFFEIQSKKISKDQT